MVRFYFSQNILSFYGDPVVYHTTLTLANGICHILHTKKQLCYLYICRVSVGGGDVWLPVFGRLGQVF